MRFLPDERPGRIIGIGDEDHASLRGDRLPDRVEVEAMFAVRDFDGPGAEEGGHQAVGDESVFRGHQLRPRPEKGVPDKFDDLVRAVAEDNIFRRKIQFLRERCAQIKTAAIGIKIRAREGLLHRGQHAAATGRVGFRSRPA